MRTSLSFLFLIGWLAGCAHSTVVPFQSLTSDHPKSYPPTNPQDIGVYRSTKPFTSFTELGLISYRSGVYDLNAMYGQLRKDSAAYGAQAVVDVKVTKETHTEFVTENQCTPQTNCNANGCTTESHCEMIQVPRQVSTFLITGSMIRENP